MTLAPSLILLAALVASLLENRHLRKELNHMSIALDALAAQVSALETQASAAVSAIAALEASGENAPALDALTARVKVAADSLAVATAPKA